MRPRIVALVSSFREGDLLASTLASARPLDGILVAEGPVEGNPPAGPPSRIPAGVKRFDGSWESDAAKRTWLLEKAKTIWQGPLWVLWLDGDELLLWGDQLHDWLGRVLWNDDPGNPVGGWPLTLVELDGSVSVCMGKLVRADLIRRYLVSSSYIEMMDGSRRTVGNVPYWTPKDGALLEHWRARPPLQGEPHLLHRSILRAGREVERQGVAEERSFRGVVLPGSGPINGSP
jgi:hypothetical protein